MYAILAHIRPLDRRTNTRVDVRVASSASGSAQGLGKFVWESAMTRRPGARIELFAIDMSPGTRAAAADVEISLTGIQEVDTTYLDWKSAPITLYRADDLQWPAVVEFSGTVVDPRLNLSTQLLTLVCQVSTAAIEKPLLIKEFGESTGYYYDPDKRTTLLPAGFGRCYNIEPVFFDTIRNMFMLDGYSNLISVDWLGEGLASMGPPVRDFSTAAQLANAVDLGIVPPGRWATCLARGMGALGAPPAGVITCHALFGFGMTGDMIRRILRTHLGFPAARIEDGSLTALDAAVPYPVHYWTAQQREGKELIEALAAGCNASPIFTMQNNFAIVRPFGGKEIAVFNRTGFSEPAFSEWSTNDVLTPYWRISARAARPGRVLAFDEINYEDELIDRGLYDPAQTYRAGNIVWLRNKSQWLYRNDTPQKGKMPPDGTPGDEFWINLAPAPDASDLRYADDGTPIQNLKPEEPGAQVSRDMTLSESVLTFVFGQNNQPVAGQLPYVVRATASKANFDVTRQTDWSIENSAGIAATINNDPSSPSRGIITITAVPKGGGTIMVRGLSGNVVLQRPIAIETKGLLADASAVSTAMILSGAITQTVSVITNSPVAGSGPPPSQPPSPPIASYTINMSEEVTVIVFINGNLLYQQPADFSADVIIDGVTRASTYAGAGAPAPGYSRQFTQTLSPGPHTISHGFRGSQGVTLDVNASLIIFVARR